MGMYGHLTVLPPPTFTLPRAAFIDMVLELCAMPNADLPVSISSGDLTIPITDDPLAPPGAVELTDGEGEIVHWYRGDNRAAIQQALQAIPYMQEPVCVEFYIYPKITVLPAPLPIFFFNENWTESRSYHIASHICDVALQKGETPLWSEVPFAPIMERYYGRELRRVVVWA